MALIKIDWHPTRAKLRSFGGFAVLVFGALAANAHFRHVVMGLKLPPASAGVATTAFAALAGLCGLLALAFPPALRPLYLALTAIGFPIGFVLSHVMLGLIYYVVVTPVGLLARARGWNPMARGFDRSAKTYWSRRPPPPPPSTYFRQY